MGTSRTSNKNPTKNPTSIAYKTRLPCMHPDSKNISKDISSTSHSTFKKPLLPAFSTNTISTRAILQIKMSALRSEHKLLKSKIVQEKNVIQSEFTKLSKIDYDLHVVENELNAIFSCYLDPWAGQTGHQFGNQMGNQMVRFTNTDIVGDVFVRNLLENFLIDLRDC